MRRLIGVVSHRFREKASVFLTELHPARDGGERAQVLAMLRKRDFDATHHCSAWREGVPVLAFGSDDDGEPSGTAGRPMLTVLEGAQATDLVAICIRWYGGTKLGTGGLVRAYTEGVQGALAEADAAGSWEEGRLLHRGATQVPTAQRPPALHPARSVPRGRGHRPELRGRGGLAAVRMPARAGPGPGARLAGAQPGR